MPIKPSGSIIVINGNSLILDDVSLGKEHQNFDRLEFSADRLRKAKSSTGVNPVYLSLFGGGVSQISTSCGGGSNSRPVVPDDIYNPGLANEQQRFNITRYTLKGLPSLASSVAGLQTLAQTHQGLLAKFEAHIKATSLDVSYDYLITQQSETFSYLTSTGITMSGNSVGTVSNILVVSFSGSVEYEIPSPAQILRSWSAQIDVRTITAANA